MGVLGARWRPDADTERIDVRRGDRPYERVVADEGSPADRCHQASQVDPPVREQADGSP